MDDQSTAFVLHKLVTEMDKTADALLQKQFGLSYNRFHFLLALQEYSPVSQHALAKTLGYSDPAVSNMVKILLAQGYLTIQPSKYHGRKRLVSLTPYGQKLAQSGQALLTEHFDKLMEQAGVNNKVYGRQTMLLLQAIRLYRV